MLAASISFRVIFSILEESTLLKSLEGKYSSQKFCIYLNFLLLLEQTALVNRKFRTSWRSWSSKPEMLRNPWPVTRLEEKQSILIQVPCISHQIPAPPFFSFFAYLSPNDAKYAKLLRKKGIETFVEWLNDTQRAIAIPKLLVTTSRF